MQHAISLSSTGIASRSLQVTLEYAVSIRMGKGTWSSLLGKTWKDVTAFDCWIILDSCRRFWQHTNTLASPTSCIEAWTCLGGI